MSTAPQDQAPPPSGDAWLGDLLKGVAVIALVAIALPLVIPAIVWQIAGEGWAVKSSYWRVRRGAWVAAAVGAAAAAVLVIVETIAIVEWVASGAAARAFDASTIPNPGEAWPVLEPVRLWFVAFGHQVWPSLWPWLLINLAAGALLIGAAFLLRRRSIATKVRLRRISNVTRQADIEQARHRAMDEAVARRIGVRSRATDRSITGVGRDAVRAPRRVSSARGATRFAFGVAARPTIRNVAELWRDKSRVRRWLAGTWVAMPDDPGQARALVVAESGAGKTELLNNMLACAASAGWKVLLLDLKGVHEDAMKTAGIARAVGASVAVSAPWAFFSGTAEQVTDRIMNWWPDAGGAADHYRTEGESALRAVQAHSPIESVDDLIARLRNPYGHTATAEAADLILREVERDGTTAGQRAAAKFDNLLRPIERVIAAPGEGWGFESLPADVTVLPIQPTDKVQLRVAAAMFEDLRTYLGHRATTGDRTPLLVIIDEFPQMSTENAAETAASTMEVSRSAGVGLVMATQTAAGIDLDKELRARLTASGTSVVLGRNADPEELVKLAGTYERIERPGDPDSEALGAGRVQNTFHIHPDRVRGAVDGQFWLIQSGAWAQFRALAPAVSADVDDLRASLPRRSPAAATSTAATAAPIATATPPAVAATVVDVEPVDDLDAPPQIEFHRTWDED